MGVEKESERVSDHSVCREPNKEEHCGEEVNNSDTRIQWTVSATFKLESGKLLARQMSLGRRYRTGVQWNTFVGTDVFSEREAET